MRIPFGMILGMSGHAKSQSKFAIRDDNLRLIFSETELKILDEKRADAFAGFYAIAGVIGCTCLTALYFFASPLPRILEGTSFQLISVSLGLMGFLGALITLVSPIIIGLLIELRKAAKARASLIDLLMHYKRPIPGDKKPQA